MKTLLFFVAVLLSPQIFASEKLAFIPYAKNEFQPVSGKFFPIPFQLNKSSIVKVGIFTPDGDLIREINPPTKLEPGKHVLAWDGKDKDGAVVPDEAYYPVLYATDDEGETETVDPHHTGGELIDDVKLKITGDKNLSFQLPYPARVLSRLGIKGGPMLKALSDWEPRNKGKVVLRWDGFDHDKLRDLRISPNISFLVVAYRLPDFSIITSGNRSLSYSAYRQKLGTAGKTSIRKKRILERNGKRVSPHYSLAKDIQLSPTVSLSFKDKYPLDEKGNPIVSCPCTVQVNLNDKEKAQLQESLYEIAFFVDDEFISEQEQGYVPFSWRWTPSGLEAGEHILTVNVSGLRGEVGVKSMKFIVPEEK